MKKPELPTLPDRIDKAIIPALQGGPHNNTIAALAVCFREAMSAEFRVYARYNPSGSWVPNQDPLWRSIHDPQPSSHTLTQLLVSPSPGSACE